MESVAYCGLVCEVCRNVGKGCKGCRSRGGDANCFQRECCLEKGIDGCWKCEGFPCKKGYFADETWKGLCLGFVHCIKGSGIESFIGLVESRLGKTVDYGVYRFKKEQDIAALLHDG